MTQPPGPALSLHGVSLERGGRRVLDGVDASFAAGRVTAVIGPNGAGKSTLLEVAAGLLAPLSGDVRLGGVPLPSIARRDLARRRAYLPQSPVVDWPISTERVVALGLTPVLPPFGRLDGALQARVDRALAACDLSGLGTRRTTELSGGELARAMLARATVGEPELLLADEPTAGLDPRHALDAARRLRALAAAGHAVVVAIHDLQLAAQLADDVVALRAGRVWAAGPLAEVFTAERLGALYDVRVRLVPDADGLLVRFLDRLPES